ncbi:Kazal-type serine proteinase inhibitor [Phytophthora megakarya]|uniref:Kazal-type serine proteinase inhibitor n=1 Tax=Phytophthora megakarya TaxID=4795 RepID=A0A225WAX7_9STRA|nr:Kazal-type serine proteinase inhibitor [Phytophthora megakarya]
MSSTAAQFPPVTPFPTKGPEDPRDRDAPVRNLAECDFECPETLAFVCGTDDLGYTNECYLRRESCKHPELNLKVKLNEECPSPPPAEGVTGTSGQ